MDRRTVFGAVAGALLTLPLTAEAQQTTRVWRIAIDDTEEAGRPPTSGNHSV